jgi:hypothetical protein
MNVVDKLAGSIAHAVLCSILLCATGCSSTPQPERTDAKPGKEARAAGSDATDVLLVNALLRHFVDRNTQQSLLLVKQAADRSPDRSDIAWLHAQLCLQTKGCDAAGPVARLRKLDPTNGTAWLGALATAVQQDDQASEDQILDALSRSKHFNIYWNTLVSRVAVALSENVAATRGDKLADPLTRAVNQTVNWISAIAIPEFQPITDTCNAPRMAQSAIAQRCALIAAALQRSDSYIAEGVGLGIAQRLATPGTQAAMKVDGRIATARYHRDTAGQLIESQLDRDKFTRELLKLMNSLPREQDVFMAVIRWAGRPTEPAAGQASSR